MQDKQARPALLALLVGGCECLLDASTRVQVSPEIVGFQRLTPHCALHQQEDIEAGGLRGYIADAPENDGDYALRELAGPAPAFGRRDPSPVARALV